MSDEQIMSLVKDALDEVAPGKSSTLESVGLDVTIGDLGLDSVSTMEMVGGIEERLNTTFPDESLAAIYRLSDLAKMIRTATT